MPDVNDKVRVLSKLGAAAARHGNDRRADAADDRQDLHDLLRLPTVRYGQNNIMLRHHAEIAVEGLRRMHKKSRRPRAGKRCGNLSADMPGFPHARDHDARLACKNARDGTAKFDVDILHQLLHGSRFHRQGFHRLFPYHVFFHSPLPFLRSL